MISRNFFTFTNFHLWFFLQVRRSFIRKVYGILCCQLLLTGAIISVFTFHEKNSMSKFPQFQHSACSSRFADKNSLKSTFRPMNYSTSNWFHGIFKWEWVLDFCTLCTKYTHQQFFGKMTLLWLLWLRARWWAYAIGMYMTLL